MAARNSRFQVEFTTQGDGKVIATFAQVEKAAGDASRVAEQGSEKWAAFGRTLGVAIGTLGGLAVTGIGLVIRNTMQAQQELAQLDAVLESTGGAAGFTRDQVVDMANAIAKASTFSGGEVTEAATRLLSYAGIAKENFRDALQVAIDQSQRLGISVTQSAEIVGRALESPTKAAAALAQQGFGAAFTQSVRDSIKSLEAAGRTAEAQQIVIDILNESYQGAAQAARDTFGGALKALKNTLTDVMTGDDATLDGMQQSIESLIDTLNDPQFRQGAAEVVGGMIDIANGAISLIAKLGEAAAALREFYGDAGKRSSVVLKNQINDTEGKLFAAERGLKNNAGVPGLGAYYASRVRSLKAELDELTAAKEMADRRAMFADVTTSFDTTEKGPAPRACSPSAKTPKTTRKAELTEEQKAAQQLQRQLEALNAQYDRKLALAGDSSEAAKLAYEFENGDLKGLTDQLAKLVFGYDSAAEARERLLNTARSIDAVEDYDAIYDDINGGLRGMKDQGKDTFDALSVYAQQAGRNIQDVFAEFLFAPFADGLDDMLVGFAKTLLQMGAQATSAKLFDAAGTWGKANAGGGGWQGMLASVLGSLFGGGRASGGGVSGGRLYQVGEGGDPELFKQNGRTYLIPGDTGHVTPASVLGGGTAGGTDVQVQINNYGSGRVEQREERTRGADGRELRRMVVDIMADDIAGGGRSAAAIRGRFGLGGA